MGKDSKPKDAKGKGKQAAGSSGGDDGGGKGGKGKGKGGKSADGLGTCTYVKGTVPSPLPWMYCTRGCLMMLGENLRGYDQISRFWTYGGASGVQ